MLVCVAVGKPPDTTDVISLFEHSLIIFSCNLASKNCWVKFLTCNWGFLTALQGRTGNSRKKKKSHKERLRMMWKKVKGAETRWSQVAPGAYFFQVIYRHIASITTLNTGV